MEKASSSETLVLTNQKKTWLQTNKLAQVVDSYSDEVRIEFRPGQVLRGLKVFVVLLSPSKQIPGMNL
jgi:hypothetical protein